MFSVRNLTLTYFLLEIGDYFRNKNKARKQVGAIVELR